MFPSAIGKTTFAEFDDRQVRFSIERSPAVTLPHPRISLVPGVASVSNPLVREGSISTIFQSLSQTFPKRFAMLSVDDCLARKPLVIYSLGGTSAD